MKAITSLPAFLNVRRYGSVAAIALMVHIFAYHCVSAQRIDPKADQFELDPIKWSKASLPTPYGLIVSFRYPITYSVSHSAEGMNHIMPVQFEAYYDTWQIGYGFKDYGNMFSIMLRTMARDVYSGLYIETGSMPFMIDKIDSNGTESTSAATKNLYGLGYKYNYGYGHRVKFNFSGEISAGKAESTEANDVYMHAELGMGARIPISTTALTIGASVFLSMMPHTRYFKFHDEEASSGGDGALVGLGVYARYAINFDKE